MCVEILTFAFHLMNLVHDLLLQKHFLQLFILKKKIEIVERQVMSEEEIVKRK